MKILYLTQLFPYPLENGGRIKTYQTLKLLSQNHQVYLCCFSPGKLSASQIEKIKPLCRQFYCLKSPYVASEFKNIKSFIFRSLFSISPFIAFRYQNAKMKDLISEWIAKEKFDAIHIDHMNLATYLPEKKQGFWVLEEHNVESEIWWEIFKKEKWNKFKFFCLVETLKLKLYERRVLPRFDHILAISQADKEKMVNLGVPKNRISVLPTACATDNKFSFKDKEKLIFFVGALFWWPNKEGIDWFYREIFPKIKKKVVGVKLMVAGIGKAEKLNWLSHSNESLVFAGHQPNLDNFWQKTSVFISPIRVGSGVRIKILTALSHGIPVVSTSKGAEGIVNKTDQGVFLADKPADFARQIITLLTNQKLAEKASYQAREFIKKEYSAHKARKVLGQIYDTR